MVQAETYEQRVAATRRRFLDGLPERLDDVDTTMFALDYASSTETRARRVHRLLHDLAGNAAMLDLPAIEDAVRKGVDVAEDADVCKRSLTDAEMCRIGDVLADTRSILAGLRGARRP